MRGRERREVRKQVKHRSMRLYCIVLDTSDTEQILQQKFILPKFSGDRNTTCPVLISFVFCRNIHK
jgi:hypothetical protein